MAEAYIVAASRTAGGRRGGRLSGWHATDLAAFVLNDLVDRTHADPKLIDDVIMGCVMQVGEQSSPTTSPEMPSWLPGCTSPCRESRLTVSAAVHSRPFTLRRRR